MQKTLTYYDNQSRQIYNIINPSAKYIYLQFPIESSVITILKVHDKSTLFYGREEKRKNRRLSIIRTNQKHHGQSVRQKKKETKKKKGYEKKKKGRRKQYAKRRMQKCSAIAVDLSFDRINCDPRGGGWSGTQMQRSVTRKSHVTRE